MTKLALKLMGSISGLLWEVRKINKPSKAERRVSWPQQDGSVVNLFSEMKFY